MDNERYTVHYTTNGMGELVITVVRTLTGSVMLVAVHYHDEPYPIIRGVYAICQIELKQWVKRLAWLTV